MAPGHPQTPAPAVRSAAPALAALLASLAGPAAATSAFDPSAPGVVFTEPDEAVRDAAGLPMWDRIERLRDLEPGLFRLESFAPGQPWQDGAMAAPHAATLFGTATPSSDTVLLHAAPGWAGAPDPTPVLLVPGAGSTASGVLVVLARKLAAEGKAVFALTFAHPQGDCFQQAEQVANALARVRLLTGAGSVDVVAHSKGGVAAAIALSNAPGVDWGEPGSRGAAYEQHGTPHDGGVRRLVLVAAPLGGLDTPFRWTAPHAATAQGEDPIAGSAWRTYYPLTSVSLLVSEDLRAVDLWEEGGEPFIGQAQLLAPFDELHALPGSRLDLGVYAAQQDWLTTYYGGLGLYSESPGLADAQHAAGDVVGRLADAGLAPGLEVSVLYGTFPFIPVDRPAIVVDPFGLSFPDFLGQGEAFYEALYEDVLADDFPGLDLTAGDIAGLGAGMLVPGEVSGLSDGVVFAASARAIEPLLSRGATLRAERGAGLSHIDLLFANPELGQSMKDRADTDGAWLRPLGERFAAEDTVGWIVEQLATEQGDDDDSGDDDSGDDDSGDDDSGDDDSSASGDDDSAPDAPPLSGCGCSAPSPPTPTWLAILLLPLAWRRR